MAQGDDMSLHDETTGTHGHLRLNLSGQSAPAPTFPSQPTDTTSGTAAQGQDPTNREPHDTGAANSDQPSSAIQSAAEERERALQARIDALEALVLQQSAASQTRPFISEEGYDNLTARAATLREPEERKMVIPDMVPGFKANPLTHGESLSWHQFCRFG
ncbi:hypothetical protein M422DRAFT_42354 [Sphaerobolus stellatus SS14]|nr:hypothetical protein M422DRAFT_42354 [Sphaerobolus stellatus SS14]